jgi:large-conductance mechanosensitive channel
MNAYRKRTAEPVPDPAPQTDVEILAEIRDLLRAQRAGE